MQLNELTSLLSCQRAKEGIDFSIILELVGKRCKNVAQSHFCLVPTSDIVPGYRYRYLVRPRRNVTCVSNVASVGLQSLAKQAYQTDMSNSQQQISMSILLRRFPRENRVELNSFFILINRKLIGNQIPHLQGNPTIHF